MRSGLWFFIPLGGSWCRVLVVFRNWDGGHSFFVEGVKTWISSSIVLFEGVDEQKGPSLERAMCDTEGSDGSVVEAGAAGVDDCVDRRFEGDRILDLSNGSAVEDFLSGVVMGEGIEIWAFVVLS